MRVRSQLQKVLRKMDVDVHKWKKEKKNPTIIFSSSSHSSQTTIRTCVLFECLSGTQHVYVVCMFFHSANGKERGEGVGWHLVTSKAFAWVCKCNEKSPLSLTHNKVYSICSLRVHCEWKITCINFSSYVYLIHLEVAEILFKTRLASLVNNSFDYFKYVE